MTSSPAPLPAVARVLSPAAIVGAVVLVFASVMMAGWTLRVPGIVGMFPGYAMAFNTALCFFVIGLALLAELLAPQPRRAVGFLCAGVVLPIAAVVLFEYALGVEPGIDWPELHRWYAAGNPHPGRMALTSSIGFLCIGASLVLMRLEPGRAALIVLRALTITAVFIGAVALLGHVLDLDEMFDVYVFKQISLPTGLGFVLVGAALWAVYRKEAWNRALFFKSEDARLMLASALILVTVATVSLLAGFVIVEQSVDRSLATKLLLTLKSRASLFASGIERYGESAGAIAARPGVTESYGQLPRDARAARSQLALRAAGLVRDEGYLAIAFKDARGVEIARSGAFIGAAPLRLELGAPRHSVLLWNGGFLLRTESAVRGGAGQLGTVLSERPIPDLQKYLVDVSDLGESGEIELCAAQGEQLSCAPTRFNPKPYLAPRAVQAVRTPMSYAVEGLTGTVNAVGYDGKKIFAAHTPVGAGGLGMVIKVGTVEYFRPIREQVLLLVPAIAALIALGLFLLRSRIHPLARRLVVSEGRLKLALEASRLALWDFDLRSGEIYLSDQWQAMLGGEARATLTTLRELRTLVHPEDGANLDRNLLNVLKGAVREYDIEHRVRKADGQWLWVRSRGEIVDRAPDGRALRMTGTNTDITARKELDAQLVYQATHDALTGFPNRGLFYDRLNQAIARSRRNRSPMAVIYLDVDKFKAVNDELGHDAGDALLKAFAERLASRVRATDTVARLGGDEFGVILETLRGRDDGRMVAEKIVEGMRAAFKIGLQSLSITTSAGIAFYDGIEKSEAERLVKKADEALYQAKGAGRNNYQVAA